MSKKNENLRADGAPVARPAGDEMDRLRKRALRLEELNRALARANARSAELMAEIEIKESQIRKMNTVLAEANARAAELVVELEQRKSELERTNRKLNQANEEKSRVLGIAAHDLRGGIGGILGLADVLAGQLTGASAEAGEYVRLIHDESARLLDLLESLLNVSRVRQGRLTLRPEQVELQAVARQALRFFHTFAAGKKQELAADFVSDPVEVIADPRRIRQVVDNLISNAIKYGRPGTEIAVRVWQQGQEGGFSVLDRGPGLSREDLKRLFHEFELLSATPTADETRHGLGLAIARKVVELHGGRIWAENRSDGAGACFSFALPLAGTAPFKARILVVDDSLTNRKLLSALLKRQGHAVETACNGNEALDFARAVEYDLVFMDVEMPDADGCAVARTIRKHERQTGRHVPIVAMTGHSDPATLGRVREAGMDDYTTKPINTRTLSLLVNRWLRTVQPSTE
ncbi:MAG: response regulator [Kiritimatiellaeota bacterium]|nr:response regulator [Kiritimatiellota bacterium]